MIKDNISINNLDRFSLHRRDKNWIIDKFHDYKSRIIPVYNSTLLLGGSANEPKAVFLTHNDFDNSLDLAESSVFLGVYDETPYFALNIKSDEKASSLSRKNDESFQSIRWTLSLLNPRDCELLTLASFMIYWHLRNQYCGKCGNKTKSKDAGHVRICKNKNCKESYFPSMDPAVIVLVSSNEQCLLGRQKGWPKGMYSTLAGFVEPGETTEENSWFTREDIKQKPQMLPNKVSISHKLIMEWVEKDD